MNKNKTREIYKLVQQITLKELGEKIDETVNQKEEQEPELLVIFKNDQVSI